MISNSTSRAAGVSSGLKRIYRWFFLQQTGDPIMNLSANTWFRQPAENQFVSLINAEKIHEVINELEICILIG